MTLIFNSAVYSDLLLEVTPKVIETEQEYEQTLGIVEKLTFNPNRTPEETALHKLLVMLVEAYEAENYAISKALPDEVLRHIMEVSHTSQEDLVGIVGSRNVVSGIVNGTQAISQAQAQILAEMFKVSPGLFVA